MREQAKRRLITAARIIGRVLSLGLWKGKYAEEIQGAGRAIEGAADQAAASSQDPPANP